MLFAAGLGTRLRPLTDTRPKALVEVAGQTLLERAIVRLKAAGAERIVVNVHHFGEQIIDFVAHHDFGVEIKISDERACLLDTGGGLRHARPLFQSDAPVLVHNVDILHNADLQALWRREPADATLLLVSARQTTRYLLFDDAMRLVGWTNTQTGEVRSPYDDIDPKKCHKLAFAGIHRVAPTLLRAMEAWPDRFSIIDYYLAQCRDHIIKGVAVPGLQLVDVGKVATLNEINSNPNL